MNVTAPHDATGAVSTDTTSTETSSTETTSIETSSSDAMSTTARGDGTGELPADPIPDGRAAACCGTTAGGIGRSEAEALAAQLAAVADPVRLQVLSILANATGGEVCACDFVGPIGKSQPTISHHLKVLAESGLVRTERRGRWVWYRLADQGLDGLMDALSAATSRD